MGLHCPPRRVTHQHAFFKGSAEGIRDRRECANRTYEDKSSASGLWGTSRPYFVARTSAMIAKASSGGVRAPMSKPIGACSLDRKSCGTARRPSSSISFLNRRRLANNPMRKDMEELG